MLYTLTPGAQTRVTNTSPWKLNEVFPIATQTAITVTANLFFPQTQIYSYKADGTVSGIYFFIYDGAWTSSSTSPVAFPAVGNDTQLGTDFVIYQPSSTGTTTFNFPATTPQTVTFAIPKLDFITPSGTESIEIYDTFDWRGGGEDIPPYETETVTLTATSTSGLTSFVYTSSDSTAGVISGDQFKMLKRQAVTITATQVGDATYSSASASVTLTPILKLAQVLTVNAPTTLKVGEYASFSYSADSGLPITATIESPSILELAADGRLHGLLPGASVISFLQDGDATYESFSEYVVVLVTGLPQTLTFTALPTLKVAETATLSATSSVGLAVNFSSSDPAVASISGSTLTINRQGYAKITATAQSSAIYDPASASQDVVIGKGTQTIFFPDIKSVPYGAGKIALVASASSGLPVTATSSNNAVALVSNGEISVLGVGSATITVSQAGDPYWTAATPQDRLLTVTKGEQAISFSAPSRLTISQKEKITAVSTTGAAVSFLATGAVSVSLENGDYYLTGLYSGTGIVTASVAGSLTYNAAAVSFSVAVGLKPQEITFTPLEPSSFNFKSFQISASASSLLPVSYSSSDTSVATVNSSGGVVVNKVGVTIITASQSGNSEWLPASSISRSIIVDKGEQQISFFPPTPVPLTTSSISLSATALGGAVSFISSNPDVATMSGSIATIKGVGVTRILATQAGSSNYLPAVAVMPLIVLPVISSNAVPTNSVWDSEVHSSINASSATSATAVSVSSPSILDREDYDALVKSAALNTGSSVPANTILDEEVFDSHVKSTTFSGASVNMAAIVSGSDHDDYVAAKSSVFSGSSITISPATVEDLSSYSGFIASSPSTPSNIVKAPYDGRSHFENYFADSGSVPDGYIIVRPTVGASAIDYLLWGRTNEDGVFLSGRLII